MVVHGILFAPETQKVYTNHHSFHPISETSKSEPRHHAGEKKPKAGQECQHPQIDSRRSAGRQRFLSCPPPTHCHVTSRVLSRKEVNPGTALLKTHISFLCPLTLSAIPTVLSPLLPTVSPVSTALGWLASPRLMFGSSNTDLFNTPTNTWWAPTAHQARSQVQGKAGAAETQLPAPWDYRPSAPSAELSSCSVSFTAHRKGQQPLRRLYLSIRNSRTTQENVLSFTDLM